MFLSGSRGFVLSSLNLHPILKGKPDVLPAAHRGIMLMYGKEASNRKQEIDRQHHTIPNQRPKENMSPKGTNIPAKR